MDDELDLQEIIRELEGDADAMGMTPPEEEDIEAIAAEGMYYEAEEEDDDINEIIEAILRVNDEETMATEPVEPEVTEGAAAAML